jgi:hypothetical protein
MMELTQIWNDVMSNNSTKIIVINYDILESNELNNRKLTALIKMHYCVDFCNFNKTMLKQIKDRPPSTYVIISCFDILVYTHRVHTSSFPASIS